MDGSTTRAVVRPARRTQRRVLSGRHALEIVAILTGVHAVVLIAAPGAAASLVEAPRGGDAIYWLRYCGILFAALTVVFWSAAKWPASMMQRPVLWTAGIITMTMSLLGGVALLDGSVAEAFALVVAVEAALALWVGWLLVTDGV
ncbi:MAG TPA: hypothetical protein VJP05_07865 [Acidimicrobiia bacterium]|nr:hypothetical protein [Acidimicrobiia bacterium]